MKYLDSFFFSTENFKNIANVSINDNWASFGAELSIAWLKAKTDISVEEK